MVEQTSYKDSLIDKLIDLAAQTEIVHHIPGRIRLKIKFAGLLMAQDLGSTDLFKYFKGVLEARTNAAARSIVISYDTRAIPPGLWDHLVNVENHSEVRKTIREELERLFSPPSE